MHIAEEIARCHHESGTVPGYPQGLRGLDIPLAARIAALPTCSMRRRTPAATSPPGR